MFKMHIPSNLRYKSAIMPQKYVHNATETNSCVLLYFMLYATEIFLSLLFVLKSELNQGVPISNSNIMISK